MRRNSGPVTITAEQLAGMAEANGLKKLAHKVRSSPAYATKAVTIINGLLAEAAAKKAAAEADAARATAEKARVEVPETSSSSGASSSGGSSSGGSAELSDREAFTMLADLVDSTLPELTADERSALKASFREEAAKS